MAIMKRQLDIQLDADGFCLFCVSISTGTEFQFMKYKPELLSDIVPPVFNNVGERLDNKKDTTSSVYVWQL